jgi:tetratricopeptide (TPR) repeat protein
VLKRFAAGLALGAALLGAQTAQATCQMQKIAELPVTMEGLRARVDAKINGQDTKLIVDTGYFFSALSDEAIAKYGVKRSTAPFGLQLRSIGGDIRDAHVAIAQDFSVAGAQFHNIEFLAGGRIGEPGVAGLLGENILGPFDVEYDLGHGMIRFFQAKGCGDSNLAYWSSGMTLSRLPIDNDGPVLKQVRMEAHLNGHAIQVVLDSGSGLSQLSLRAASSAGVQTTSPGVTPAGVGYGVFGAGREDYLAPFASFKIGDEEIRDTQLRMSNINLGRADMLLGVDFFLSHRILVSNTQKKIYFTYNGGPVFRLDQAGTRTAQTQAQPTPGVPTPTTAIGAPAASGGDQPATAADFLRRGQALAARRDFSGAVDDFGKGIELEPANSDLYIARANARLASRQAVLAMSDLNQALKIKPDDPRALLSRGDLYLDSGDVARARSDFEAALKAAPDNADLRLRIGGAYSNAGQFDAAIEQFDVWVAAHPNSDARLQILAGRCWARTAANKDLDKALADCNAAATGERVSIIMEPRGFLLLRLGRFDEAIAQFNGVLRLQPRDASAFLGRGLAELKKGQKADGERDLAQAVAIEPTVAARYKRFGFTPDAVAGGQTAPGLS